MMPVTDHDEYDGPVSMAATQSTMSKAEQRKSNKPIMEKRRRARINHCLNELKTLILNAMKKDPARHSKLEKADILEMTVKHLQNVQRSQLASSSALHTTDPAVLTRFRSGFDECAAEVSRYIGHLDGVDHGVKQRLSAHLHRCVNSLQQLPSTSTSGISLPSPPTSSVVSSYHHHAHDSNNNNNNNNNMNGQRLQLVPSRLMSGEMALVLPNSSSLLNPNSTSAFKPPTSPKAFQPFQVELPNSHLKAHISIPDTFDRPTPVQLKPNPNYKMYHSPQKSRHDSEMAPPVKIRRRINSPQQQISPLNYSSKNNHDSRISVIVKEHAKNEVMSVGVANSDGGIEVSATARDMWRPW